MMTVGRKFWNDRLMNISMIPEHFFIPTELGQYSGFYSKIHEFIQFIRDTSKQNATETRHELIHGFSRYVVREGYSYSLTDMVESC